jgi:hypothetical protein
VPGKTTAVAEKSPRQMNFFWRETKKIWRGEKINPHGKFSGAAATVFDAFRASFSAQTALPGTAARPSRLDTERKNAYTGRGI